MILLEDQNWLPWRLFLKFELQKKYLQTDFLVKLRNFLLFVPRSARFVIFSEIATQPLNVQFFRQIIEFEKSLKYRTFEK